MAYACAYVQPAAFGPNEEEEVLKIILKRSDLNWLKGTIKKIDFATVSKRSVCVLATFRRATVSFSKWITVEMLISVQVRLRYGCGTVRLRNSTVAEQYGCGAGTDTHTLGTVPKNGSLRYGRRSI